MVRVLVNAEEHRPLDSDLICRNQSIILDGLGWPRTPSGWSGVAQNP